MPANDNRLDILFVSMPWSNALMPSIQLGLLKTLMDNAGIAAATMSAFTMHCDWLVSRKLLKDWDEYNKCGDTFMLFEWTFTGALTGDARTAIEVFVDAQISLDGVSKPKKPKKKRSWPSAKLLDQIKAESQPFLDRLLEHILAANPRIVGFSSTYQQNVASLGLAKMIKAKRPDIQIMFGGSNVEGVKGEALLTLFPCVDVVFRGDAESIAGAVVHKMLAGEPLDGIKGVSFRCKDGSIVLNGSERNKSNVEDWVVPNYDEYYTTLDRLSTGDLARGGIMMPFENSRGCWWGQKHQCRFCALNSDFVFRSKRPEQALADLRFLADKYQQQNFLCVDNILHHIKYSGILDEMAKDDDHEFRLFFEVKSNIGLSDLIRLKKAGVWSLQPGIESLSTPTLALVNKGVTAIQNVRFLKNCAWVGIKASWNLLFGLPGEDPAECGRMVDLIKSIGHFEPPSFNGLVLQRASIYCQDPEKYGIRNLGPSTLYSILYGMKPDQLEQLADSFAYEYTDGRDVDKYSRGLDKAVERWNKNWPASKNTLVFYRINKRITIVDKRTELEPALHHLEELETYIYDQCFDIASLDKLAKDERLVSVGLGRSDIEAFLETLVAKRLMIREGDQFLGLAISSKPIQMSQHWLNG